MESVISIRFQEGPLLGRLVSETPARFFLPPCWSSARGLSVFFDFGPVLTSSPCWSEEPGSYRAPVSSRSSENSGPSLTAGSGARVPDFAVS